jgi:hypothetical protein
MIKKVLALGFYDSERNRYCSEAIWYLWGIEIMRSLAVYPEAWTEENGIYTNFP